MASLMNKGHIDGLELLKVFVRYFFLLQPEAKAKVLGCCQTGSVQPLLLGSVSPINYQLSKPS